MTIIPITITAPDLKAAEAAQLEGKAWTIHCCVVAQAIKRTVGRAMERWEKRWEKQIAAMGRRLDNP